MPDWSYQTIFRPLFFQMSDDRAKRFALSSMNRLYHLPFGKKLIEWMGHMAPHPAYQTKLCDHTFASSIGISSVVDHEWLGVEPFSLFGAGFIDLGIVTLQARAGEVRSDRALKRLTVNDPWANAGVEVLLARQKDWRLQTPVMVGLGHAKDADIKAATTERLHLMEMLHEKVDFFVVPMPEADDSAYEKWKQHLKQLRERCSQLGKPLLLSLPVYDQLNHSDLESLCKEIQVEGIVLNDLKREAEGFVFGDADSVPDMVEWIEQLHNRDIPLIVSSSIHEPDHAQKLMNAGATCVQLDSGLIFSGPGLPKRISEYTWQSQQKKEQTTPTTKPVTMGWIFALLLALSLIGIGLTAWYVSFEPVIFPYDEAITGVSKEELMQLNDRLIPFMGHDRITLAGTTLSLGIIYIFVAVFAIRKQFHWAYMLIYVSSVFGFMSLFYFLGHGYLDPLHLFLAVFMFPIFLLYIQVAGKHFRATTSMNKGNTAKWKLALWGQLSFVILGAALLLGGVVISFIGMTEVFVPEDLKFLQLQPEELEQTDPDIIPLIAHDRAGFGGTLIAVGLAVLLLALWGFREGEAWLWWTFCLGALPAFISGIGIHFYIGYVDWVHLAPPFIAVGLYVVGLICSFAYLHAPKRVA
ncbi:hypothetical protein IC619_016040 [Hazenella sp. IB182353]|uniref:hypothetical protein n=1 Tax=Polycladospora coralii TaxID=2771432 RepID=UPI0017460357|nr:hypothetical protein [Polycladospora coralii]MBS7531963.1 hypothetical protein [Polycladospora coralii]